MGNTVPPRASSSRNATGGTGGRRRSDQHVVVVTEAAAPLATPSRVVATVRKQGRDDDDDDEVEETTTRAGRSPRAGAGRALKAGAPAAGGNKVVTVKIVMTRKDAEALVARLKAQSARERKVRMAELKGALRAGSRDARRPMLPPIKENRFERT